MKDVCRALAALFLVVALAPACDDENDPVDDVDGRDVPEAVEGCADGPDGEDLIAIGEIRACECDDGTTAEQTCLSTGEFADCKCAGGGW